MEDNVVGERIRELRRAKNLTQDELAALLNTSRVQINQWETGARELPTSRLIDFASALETSCDYLLRGVPCEQAESFNKTGLDVHSLNALSDVMNLTEHKKKQTLFVLNSILGSDYFWKVVMPHIMAAISIQENAVLGGAFDESKNLLPENMVEKLKESIDTVTLHNASGYTDHIIINKETAIAFKLNEAINSLGLLLKAIVEKHGLEKNSPLASFVSPYKLQNVTDEKVNVTEFVEYLKAMGIDIR